MDQRHQRMTKEEIAHEKIAKQVIKEQVVRVKAQIALSRKLEEKKSKDKKDALAMTADELIASLEGKAKNSPEPWKGQEGSESFLVIYNSKIWSNAWWVGAIHCPGEAEQDPGNNPWRFVRAATLAEIALGNPKDCKLGDELNCGKVLCEDPATEAMYAAVDYKPDNSGESNLSYTSARVVKSVYNKYLPQSDAIQSHKPEMLGYLTDWCQYDGRIAGDTSAANAGRGFDLANIPADAYDVLIFAFLAIFGDVGEKKEMVQKSVNGWNHYHKANPDKQMKPGHIVLIDPWGDLATSVNVGLESGHPNLTYENYCDYYQQSKAAGLLGGLWKMKQQNPDLKLAFSIGGWTLSSFFSDMVKNDTMIETFVDSVVDFFKNFPMFDGVDIDWEYPGDPGAGNSFDKDKDGDNYAKLVKELSDGLKKANLTKSITVALSSVVEKLEYSKVDLLADNGVSKFFVMSYDFFGTGWSPTLCHHTNLHDSPISTESAVSAIAYLFGKLTNLRSHMLYIGIAGYGRAATGANLFPASGECSLDYAIQGEALGTYEPGAYEFFDIVKNALDLAGDKPTGKNGFTLLLDSWGNYVPGNPSILYNKTTNQYISLDVPLSARAKGSYASTSKLGGVFIWSADQDNGCLYNSAKEGAGYKASTPVNFPMDKFYNQGDGQFAPSTCAKKPEDSNKTKKDE